MNADSQTSPLTTVALDEDGSPGLTPAGIEPSSSSAPTPEEAPPINGAGHRRARSIRAGTTGTSTARTDASSGSFREAQDPTCRSHVDPRPALTNNNDGPGRTHLDGGRAAGANGGE